MELYEVTGFPSLDIQVDAVDEAAAREAWAAVLEIAGQAIDFEIRDGVNGRWTVRMGFFTGPADQPATDPLRDISVLDVTPGYDPDAEENQPDEPEPVKFDGDEWFEIAGKGTVLTGGYPFDCPSGEAIGQRILALGEIYRIRGVETYGSVNHPKRGAPVGLLLTKETKGEENGPAA